MVNTYTGIGSDVRSPAYNQLCQVPVRVRDLSKCNRKITNAGTQHVVGWNAMKIVARQLSWCAEHWPQPDKLAMRRWRISLRALVVSIVLVLSTASTQSCGGCKDTIISTKVVDGTEITLHHRVCGSVAGYAVSFAPPHTDIVGRASHYEPFRIECDCYKGEVSPPVNFEVASSHQVVIRYDVKRVWRLAKTRTVQGSFRIEYIPYDGHSRSENRHPDSRQAS